MSIAPITAAAEAPADRAVPVLLVLTGIVTALCIGKLPPVLADLQRDVGLTLVQAGWLVALFMVAAACIGIAGGSIADRFGPRRVMLTGMGLLAGAGVLGALATNVPLLFASRAAESLGSLLVVLPVPALLRRSVPVRQLSTWLGIWAAYMPVGMAVGLVATPLVAGAVGWRAAWLLLAALCAAWTIVLWWPAGPLAQAARQPQSAPHALDPPPLLRSIGATLRAPGPWLLSLCFMCYAGQFIGIFSFLPLIYTQAGIGAGTGSWLTALGVLANVAGTVASGVLLQRGIGRSALITFSGLSMALLAWIAFGSEAGFALRYLSLVMLSAIGGLIPGALFASVPIYAPNPSAVSTTVGWMQQGSAIGQLILPPIFAATAQHTGSWGYTWMISGAAAGLTVVIARLFARLDQHRGATIAP